jgi:hypothetical protein
MTRRSSWSVRSWTTHSRANRGNSTPNPESSTRHSRANRGSSTPNPGSSSSSSPWWRRRPRPHRQGRRRARRQGKRRSSYAWDTSISVVRWIRVTVTSGGLVRLATDGLNTSRHSRRRGGGVRKLLTAVQSGPTLRSRQWPAKQAGEGPRPRRWLGIAQAWGGQP